MVRCVVVVLLALMCLVGVTGCDGPKDQGKDKPPMPGPSKRN
jgi:hypothetical protein